MSPKFNGDQKPLNIGHDIFAVTLIFCAILDTLKSGIMIFAVNLNKI